MPEPRSSESPQPPSWSEWKAQNGSKIWCWRAPLAVEWALERFVYRLRGLALFDLLELLGKLTVLVAVIFWFLEADSRAKERHYRAWELINAARDSPGDGGRRDALQDLNKDHVSLAFASLDQAHLPQVDLQGANLQDASLNKANLQGARLQGANLQGAKLQNVNLQDANLQGANLQSADLQGAELWGANLQGANLWGARLQRANLNKANLQGATLRLAILQGANLWEAKMQAVDLSLENLQGANGLTQEQLDAAKGDEWTEPPAGLTRPAHWPTDTTYEEYDPIRKATTEVTRRPGR